MDLMEENEKPSNNSLKDSKVRKGVTPKITSHRQVRKKKKFVANLK